MAHGHAVAHLGLDMERAGFTAGLQFQVDETLLPLRQLEGHGEQLAPARDISTVCPGRIDIPGTVTLARIATDLRA